MRVVPQGMVPGLSLFGDQYIRIFYRLTAGMYVRSEGLKGRGGNIMIHRIDWDIYRGAMNTHTDPVSRLSLLCMHIQMFPILIYSSVITVVRACAW